MTTIAWDGESLATDCRSTNYKLDESGERIESGFTDDVDKYYTPDKPTFFHKAEVVMIAAAGNHGLTTKLCELVESGKDIEDYLRKALALGVSFPSAGLIIVCKETVWTLEVFGNSEKKRLTVVEVKPDEKVALGSGSPIANFFMRTFNAPAWLAVIAASTEDRHTGHKSVSRRRDTPMQAEMVFFTTEASVQEALVKHVKHPPRKKRVKPA